jgi:hypothetical protein
MKQEPKAYTFSNRTPNNIWEIIRTLQTASKRKKMLEILFPDSKFEVQKYQRNFYVTGKLSG